MGTPRAGDCATGVGGTPGRGTSTYADLEAPQGRGHKGMGFRDSGPHPAADAGLRPEVGSGLVRNSAEHVPHGIQH